MNKKVIQMTQMFVCVIAHRETGHGDTEIQIGREKKELCNAYYTIPCEVHTKGGSAVSRFFEGTIRVPATVFCDPYGNELSKESGNLTTSALVKKMQEALAEVKGAKISTAVWRSAHQLRDQGKKYEEEEEYSRAASCYKKIGSIRGSEYFKKFSRDLLKELNEAGLKLLEEALALEDASDKKSALRKIQSNFRSLPVADKAEEALKDVK